jgi:hypothetical protein
VECSTPAGAANGRYFSLSALSQALATCEETERRRSSSYLTGCQDLRSGRLGIWGTKGGYEAENEGSEKLDGTEGAGGTEGLRGIGIEGTEGTDGTRVDWS